MYGERYDSSAKWELVKTEREGEGEEIRFSK